jgi:TolB-like protein
MYLAPEVLSGQRPTAAADVYALGVMLYQLVAGDFRKPLSPGWETQIADPLVREDISEAACGDPSQRMKSAAKLAERLSSLEKRRIERAEHEELQMRQRMAERRREQSQARRPWMLAAGAALAVAVLVTILAFYRHASSASSQAGAVAVLPFQNAGSDHTVDFLSLAVPDEIETQLSYSRSLPIRPFSVTSKYTQPSLDLQRVARELRVSRIVTGRFLRAEEKIAITLEAIDIESNRLLWRGKVSIPAGDLRAMQGQLAGLTRTELAPSLAPWRVLRT